MTGANVLTRGRPPGENALRDALAEGLAVVQASKTDLACADDLNWSIGTIRNVRNRNNTASFKLVSDAAWNSAGAFLAPWLARLGLRAVPLADTCTSDAGAQSKLARLGLKLAVALENGFIDQGEAIDMLPDVDAFQAHLDRIRNLAAGTAK